MGYFGQRRYSYSAPEKVVNETIDPRLKRLLENTGIPANTVSFLQSLLEANEKYEGLTVNQYAALEKIEVRFSEAAVAKRLAWADQYGPEQKKIAKICAEYYLANPPYYRDLARKLINDSEFVPTERQYRALCENKYAKKIIAATLEDPKFAVGSMVSGRACAVRDLKNKLLMIIEVNAKPVLRAAKGAKVYRVLPVGNSQMFYCEERDLKQAKGIKQKG